MDQSPDAPAQPAEYYRQKAAQAREAAQGLTTPALKARLLDLVLHYEQLADNVERAAREPSILTKPARPAGQLRRR